MKAVRKHLTPAELKQLQLEIDVAILAHEKDIAQQMYEETLHQFKYLRGNPGYLYRIERMKVFAELYSGCDIWKLVGKMADNLLDELPEQKGYVSLEHDITDFISFKMIKLDRFREWHIGFEFFIDCTEDELKSFDPVLTVDMEWVKKLLDFLKVKPKKDK